LKKICFFLVRGSWVKSKGGAKHYPVHELRDPYIINDNGHKYMFYTVAGETGISVVEIVL